MKGKTVFKLLLDFSMTLLYMLLMFAGGLGAFFHEAAGIGLGLLFAAHVAVNVKSVKGMSAAARAGKASVKARIMLMLDKLLYLGMPIVLITGVLIAQTLFNMGLGAAWDTVYWIHDIASWVCLAVLTAHVSAHAKYLAAAGCAMVRRFGEPDVRKTFGRFAAGTMAALSVYLMLYTVYKNGLPGIAETALTTETTGTQQTESAVVSAAGKKDDDDSTAAVSAPVTTQATVTLSEFLGKLYCTSCGKHCPLSNPRCGKSASQIAKATAQYNELYAG